MLETEQQVINALETWISRNAAERILGRVLLGHKRSSQSMAAGDWADLIEGPLLKELAQVLPIPGLVGPLGNLVKNLRSQAKTSAIAVAEPPTLAEGKASAKLGKDKALARTSPTISPSAIPPTEWVNLVDEASRRTLIQEIARLDGVMAVVLETPNGIEMRAPNFGKGLPRLISMSHRLLALRGDYRVLYTTFQTGQLLVRPLGSGWLAVLARSEANLGQLLYRLRYMQPRSHS